jgi:membrane protein
LDYENAKCIDEELKYSRLCKIPDISKENYFKIKPIKSNVYAMSHEGSLIFSENQGLEWNLIYFKDTRIKDFAVSSNGNIFIIKENGDLIRFKINSEIMKLTIKSNTSFIPNRIRYFNPNLMVVLGDQGEMLISENDGNSFNEIINSGEQLQDVEFVDSSYGVVVGNKGTILLTNNSGKSWTNVSHKNYSFEKVWIVPFDKINLIIILNNIGDIYASKDSGATWDSIYQTKVGKISDLVKLSKSSDQEADPKKFTPNVMGVGEFSRIMGIQYLDGKFSFKSIRGGNKFFSMYTILGSLIPILTILGFFIGLYSMVPNIKIPFKPVFLGSLFTSFLLVVFVWSFVNIYLTSFSDKTFVVYKALAFFPLLFMVINILFNIVLFGAELVASIQYKRYLEIESPGESKEISKYSFNRLLELILQIYLFQEKNKKLPTIFDLESVIDTETELLRTRLDLLVKFEILGIGDNSIYYPVLSSHQLTLKDIFEISSKEFMNFNISVLDSNKLKSIDNELKSSKEELIQKLDKFTIQDLIKST